LGNGEDEVSEGEGGGVLMPNGVWDGARGVPRVPGTRIGEDVVSEGEGGGVLMPNGVWDGARACPSGARDTYGFFRYSVNF
ncbi:hypothetical protein Tco_0562242, partial [Tanacetum coccineum]